MIKIVFTGGGTGGHFYPIIAVAEEVLKIADERKLIAPELVYIATDPYDERLLYEHEIAFKRAPAGKLRNYASTQNITDTFKTAFGSLKAVFMLFSMYPDVIFSKGSYVSVPTVFAAKTLGIPIIIHDSDAIPGRANLWASKYAARIGISYPQAADYFKGKAKDKVALIGNPVRAGIAHAENTHGKEHFGFSNDIPTILFLGGSQGAKHINTILIQALPELLNRYQIIHQTGKELFGEVKGTTDITLEQHEHKYRYKMYPYLDDLTMRMAAGAADLVISRAGSGSIFELAAWGKPALLIPIREEVSRDQRKNAYAVARLGGAQVIEETNLTPHLLLAELERLFANPQELASLQENIKQLYRPNAARQIAEQLVAIALKHEEA